MGRGSGHKKNDGGGLLPSPGQHAPQPDASVQNGSVSGGFDIGAYISDDATPDKPLKGQQFAVTGLLTGKERFHLEKDLRAKGAIIRNRVAPELRCLIVGQTAGDSSPKMRWAQRNGVEMISWSDFARSFYADDADLIAKLDEAEIAAAQDAIVAATADSSPAGSVTSAPASSGLISADNDSDSVVQTPASGQIVADDSNVVSLQAAPPVSDVPVIADEDLVEDEEEEDATGSESPTYNFAEGDALAGECYVIAGTVNGITSSEMTARLQAQGAIVADTVTIGVDAVIKGDNLGDDEYQAKLDAAERYDVPLLAYSEIAQHL